jgi:8-oxo-dGTP pyrophosphatase MutT (NUDIX family)
MELLRTIKEEEVYPESNANAKDSNSEYRKAVRAVVFDDENKVALINVVKYNYYKLPGGGVEESEQDEDALQRECLEEIGCRVEIVSEIGRVLEHRNKIGTDQESFCFLANLSGEKGKPNLVGYEITDGFKTVWVDIDECIKLVENSKPTSYDGPFIKIRDIVFLKAAKKLIKK